MNPIIKNKTSPWLKIFAAFDVVLLVLFFILEFLAINEVKNAPGPTAGLGYALDQTFLVAPLLFLCSLVVIIMSLRKGQEKILFTIIGLLCLVAPALLIYKNLGFSL